MQSVLMFQYHAIPSLSLSHMHGICAHTNHAMSSTQSCVPTVFKSCRFLTASSVPSWRDGNAANCRVIKLLTSLMSAAPLQVSDRELYAKRRDVLVESFGHTWVCGRPRGTAAAAGGKIRPAHAVGLSLLQTTVAFWLVTCKEWLCRFT